MKDIFEKDRDGEMVSPDDSGYEALIADIFDTMRIATEMNTGCKTPYEVHGYMGRLVSRLTRAPR